MKKHWLPDLVKIICFLLLTLVVFMLWLQLRQIERASLDVFNALGASIVISLFVLRWQMEPNQQWGISRTTMAQMDLIGACIATVLLRSGYLIFAHWADIVNWKQNYAQYTLQITNVDFWENVFVPFFVQAFALCICILFIRLLGGLFNCGDFLHIKLLFWHRRKLHCKKLVHSHEYDEPPQKMCILAKHAVSCALVGNSVPLKNFLKEYAIFTKKLQKQGFYIDVYKSSFIALSQILEYSISPLSPSDQRRGIALLYSAFASHFDEQTIKEQCAYDESCFNEKIPHHQCSFKSGSSNWKLRKTQHTRKQVQSRKFLCSSPLFHPDNVYVQVLFSLVLKYGTTATLCYWVRQYLDQCRSPLNLLQCFGVAYSTMHLQPYQHDLQSCFPLIFSFFQEQVHMLSQLSEANPQGRCNDIFSSNQYAYWLFSCFYVLVDYYHIQAINIPALDFSAGGLGKLSVESILEQLDAIMEENYVYTQFE